MAYQAPQQPPADAGQKQKKKPLHQDFQETALWEHDEHSKDDIEDFICSELKIVNDSAGLSGMPKLTSEGNTWVTKKSSITSTILTCQRWQRSECPC